MTTEKLGLGSGQPDCHAAWVEQYLQSTKDFVAYKPLSNQVDSQGVVCFTPLKEFCVFCLLQLLLFHLDGETSG